MNDYLQILLTGIVGGLFFLFGQFILKYYIDPIFEYRKSILKIVENIIFYKDIYTNLYSNIIGLPKDYYKMTNEFKSLKNNIFIQKNNFNNIYYRELSNFKIVINDKDFEILIKFLDNIAFSFFMVNIWDNDLKFGKKTTREIDKERFDLIMKNDEYRTKLENVFNLKM